MNLKSNALNIEMLMFAESCSDKKEEIKLWVGITKQLRKVTVNIKHSHSPPICFCTIFKYDN
jgi:hypothetical protein